MARSSIPGKGRALDGMTVLPGRQIEPYIDWEVLEREFILNTEFSKVSQWLHTVKGWPIKKIRNGNTLDRTTGWGKKRAKRQQLITQEAIDRAMEAEMKFIPDLRRAKAELIKGIVKDVGRWDRLNATDKQLCYQIMKVELREPTNVKDMPPAGARDPVEALLEEYGLMRDGEIIDDNTADDSRLVSGADSIEAPKADSTSPVEVPQD